MDHSRKIYPQAIKGKFRSIKTYFSYFLLSIFFFSSWLRWDRGPNTPNQALLIDLPNRKAYFFAIQIWPEDIYYIVAILIIAAMGLFL